MNRMRSVLFTPGGRPDRIRKALTTGAADVVVADLEDAVAPADKQSARQAVTDLLHDVAHPDALAAVRINAWPTRLAEEDLASVVPTTPDLIVLPKAADPDHVTALDARLTELEEASGLEPGRIRLLLILETAAGVLAARSLADASGRVAATAFGAEDLAADAGMRRSAENTEVAVPRSLVALAAAASGVRSIDMITADYQDLDRTAREANEARGLGYAGKMCIHPDQVAVVHEAFAPTAEEQAWARTVLETVARDDVGAGGVVVVDGKMIDRPLIEQARRILES